MAGNSIGTLFRVTTFGESHGPGIGAIIDGCPAGIDFDYELLERDLLRRRPGQSELTTSRNESDKVEVLSGIFEDKTTGAPIALFIRNTDQKSQDYENLKNLYRPGHADYTYEKKYGIRDYRGGGRSSARETAARVAAGSVAKMILNTSGIEITAWVSAIGKIELPEIPEPFQLANIEGHPTRCPDPVLADQMAAQIEQAKQEGDSLGGMVSCLATNVAVGLGEPVFDKLNADLAKSMLSINAVKGFEIGSGFAGSKMKGSEHNDEFFLEDDKISARTNHAGGIQGGISNGLPVFFRVAFKPVSTIKKNQNTVSRDNIGISFEAQGRHDPCVVPRAVPIVEAMAAITLADHLLRAKTSRLS